MYEANAIQFGMDQMMEASSGQLSSFIHWYYWCAHIGPLFNYYMLVGVFIYIRNCVISFKNSAFLYLDFTTGVPAILQIVLSACCLIITVCFRNHLFINKTKRNYFKLIFRVLQYSFKHKNPVNRSAFTYWEDYIPSRIDLGKEKYGGPYSTEEVEDVKTFLRLLLLLASLFGLQFSGKGYSLVQYYNDKSGLSNNVANVNDVL